MNRYVMCAVLAVAYLGVRPHARAIISPSAPTAAPVTAVADVARTMNQTDRAAMRDAYATLSKALAADPEVEPVFVDVATLRRAHRAMLLCVWRGLLDNDPGKYPGLKEAVEGAFNQRIGTQDVLLNPDLKRSAAKAMADISASFK